MYIRLIILFGKFIARMSKILNRGAGGTWPGEVVLTISPHILQNLSTQLKKGIILVAGTNGKTTTSLMIKKILEKQGPSVIHNNSGANLVNGVVSAFIQHANWWGKVEADWGVFEVDENSLPAVISSIPTSSAGKQFPISNKKGKFSTNTNNNKLVIVLLNLFRDQLDRYGEVDVIAEKWNKTLGELPDNSSLILNADDPQIAYLGESVIARSDNDLPRRQAGAAIPNEIASPLRMARNDDVIYFGIEDKKQLISSKEHATDSTFCPKCGARLTYQGLFFSHLGHWRCTKCEFKRPKPVVFSAHSPLPGQYNLYNTLAAYSVAQILDIPKKEVEQSLKNFQAAFGRQESFTLDKKHIKLFLSKNPTGFNASLRTVLELKAKHVLLVLNDRIPDGRDVSWIWDVDFEMIPDAAQITVSGDRTYDLALRMKYAGNNKNSYLAGGQAKIKIQHDNAKFIIAADLTEAITKSLKLVNPGETLYVLATYSAMLEVRKILSGRKIL
ncbi:Mur ligase family protein [Candidatus Microgenomates bacterium]|nr:MAG: Mur ligase family protein [Candidatus Microgenomates bacterium]